MRRIPSLLSLTALALAVGCNDTTRPVTPQPVAGGPNADISDGSFGGNPDFFFLPTLAPDPRKNPNFDPGKFNPNLAPVVKVCLLDATTAITITPATSCVGSPLVTLSGSNITILPRLESYLAVWNLRTAPPNPHKFYRIQVFVGSTLLGFVDVSVVTTLGEARLALTGEVLPLVSGLTLPIPFRIETGALGACKRSTDCTEASVTPQGGTFFTSTHHAALQLSKGWASDAAFAAGGGTIQLTIERRTLAEGQACHAGASGTLYEEQNVCYHYETDPSLARYGGFQTPDNVAAQCSTVPRTELNKATEEWVLFKSDGERPLQPLANAPEPTGLDCTNFAFMESLPSNPVLRLASIGWHSVTSAAAYAVGVRVAYAWDDGLGGHLIAGDILSDFSWGKARKKAKVSGDEQTAGAGSAVYPKVKITTYHHGTALANVPVTFTALNGIIRDGDLSVTTKIVATDENGEASVPWSVAGGANSLLVTAPTIDEAPLTFTATGLVNGTVVGTVKTASGIGLGGVLLTLTGDIASRTALTNAHGEFIFYDVPAGSYSLAAALLGYSSTQQSVTVTAGQPSTVNFVLMPTNGRIFRATFEGDAVGSPPGAPEIGTWDLTQMVDGTALVKSGVGGFETKALEVASPGLIPGAPLVIGKVAGTPPSSGRYVVRWSSSFSGGESPTMNFSIRSSGVYPSPILAAIGYQPNGSIVFNPGDIGSSRQVGSWTANIPTQIEFIIDLTAKTVSLYINGAATVVDVPYFQPQYGTDLASVILAFGGLGAYSIVWDDVEIYPQPSP